MKRLATGVLASAFAMAVVTAAIELIKPYVPVLSLGVLYVFAVLPIAVAYGLGLALVVSVASMLAFNWFHLQPVHTFTLADSSNWFALAVYLATAVVVSELAARSRRRAAAAEQRERESALLAELATELLRGRDLYEELGEIASRAARVLGVESAIATLRPYAIYAGTSLSMTVLIALLVALIPTTIGALLSAIGIAGMDRLVQRNVLAMSGRAVEASGDVDVLLLDKTGTITLGNRQAAEFLPVDGVEERELAEVAQLASLADETPEGARSSCSRRSASVCASGCSASTRSFRSARRRG
jgi:hypothetical protein